MKSDLVRVETGLLLSYSEILPCGDSRLGMWLCQIKPFRMTKVDSACSQYLGSTIYMHALSNLLYSAAQRETKFADDVTAPRQRRSRVT